MKSDDEVAKSKCHQCGGISNYSVDWDSKFCPKCCIWLEQGCGCEPKDNTERIECYYECWKRPEKPL